MKVFSINNLLLIYTLNLLSMNTIKFTNKNNFFLTTPIIIIPIFSGLHLLKEKRVRDKQIYPYIYPQIINEMENIPVIINDNQDEKE